MAEILKENIDITKQIEWHIRPLTFPVGIKFIKDNETVDDGRYCKPTEKYNLCQYLSLARYDRCHQDVYYVKKEDIICSMALVALGFNDWPEDWTNGEKFLNIHHKNLEDSQESVRSVPLMPKGELSGLIIGPLEKMDVRPDLVFLAILPGQLNRISEGYQWFNSGGLNVKYSGICGVCGWTVVKAYLEKTLVVGFPCQGSRRFGNYQDIELIVGISSEILDEFLDGLEKTYVTGHSYPIGIGMYPNPSHAPHYRIIEWPNKVERA